MGMNQLIRYNPIHHKKDNTINHTDMERKAELQVVLLETPFVRNISVAKHGLVLCKYFIIQKLSSNPGIVAAF
jgi:hypothetical protein